MLLGEQGLYSRMHGGMFCEQLCRTERTPERCTAVTSYIHRNTFSGLA